MRLNPSQRRRDDSSDQGQAKRQRNDGDAGRASKMLRKEKRTRVHGVLPAASKLEAVPILRKVSGGGIGGRKRRGVDGSALNEKGK